MPQAWDLPHTGLSPRQPPCGACPTATALLPFWHTACSSPGNVDTPGYKARDLDFDAALRDAQGQGGNGLLASTAEQHYRSGSIDGLNPFQVLREGVQPSLDGNTVDPDAERAAYGRAALEYRASLSFVESKVRSMLTAITGQ